MCESGGRALLGAVADRPRGFGSSLPPPNTTHTGTFNSFIAAAAVTFASGIVSRFNGRQAIGNTMAGLFVLVPGAYAFTSFFDEAAPFTDDGYDDGAMFAADILGIIVTRAVIIGLGAWTGTLLCSPTVLGTNREWVWRFNRSTSRATSFGVPAQDAIFFM